jgi:class 3 adenylate cyclase
VPSCPSCGKDLPGEFPFCPFCAAPLTATLPAAAAEERKIVTVVFVDLVGFTAQAERLDPEDVRGLLEPYHAHLREELERRGGTVEKFIGDAVMAVFGAPAAHEDDPERALRAAFAIRDWAAEQGDLQVRVGVNTGEALVKVGARPAAGEAMVAGDVVNTAARMQAAAPVNGVLVGAATYRATRDAITYREAPAVEAKGKADPIAVWEALDPVASYGVDLAEREQTPLLGRDRELELLGSIFGRVRDELTAQLVTIVGVPGIGKSRVVRELFRLVDDEAELITWRQGRCLPYGESVAFWALGEIVKAEAGILESDSSADAERKLSEAVARLVSEASERRWLEAALRALVGVSRDGTGGAGAETTTAAWRRFLEAIAERGPTVLVFEDLHWADDGLLDFLDDLVDWLRGVPLLVVGTARPELLERRPAWGGGKANATAISLQPLAEEDTARLIAALMQQPLQLADEQRTLLERAGGNPLFAEQYVRMLSERGTTGELPESVQGVIAARIDALPGAEKELLQEASVHGKVFWLGGVASAAGVDPAEAERRLRALERKDFVARERRSTVAGDTQYSFQHVLLRDVAYGQIPRRARAEKHRGAAAWIEGLGRPDDHAELLAHHYKQALELARAAALEDDPTLVVRTRDALRAAGERAMALSAYESAAACFVDALELCPRDDPERPRLLLQHAGALLPFGGPGLEVLPEAIEGFRAVGDPEGEAEAATLAARFAWFAGDRSATDAYIDLAVAAVGDRPQSRARAAALTNKSGFVMLQARYEEAIRVGAEALPLVEALGMDIQRARLHIVIGTAHWGLGDTRGLDEIREGISIAETATDFDMVGVGYDNLAAGLHCYGRLEDARRMFSARSEHCERYGLSRLLRFIRTEAAEWDYLDGNWDDAIAVADELIGVAEGGSRHYSDPEALSLRAWIRLARGDATGADHDSERAVALARASDSQAQSAAYPIRAAVAFAVGKRTEADELVSELAAMGKRMVGALNTPFPTLPAVAWVFRDVGREEEFIDAVLDADPIKGLWNEASRAIAEGELVRAAEIIEDIGHTAGAAYARLRAAEALAAAGKEAEAAAQRAQAEDFYRTVGAIRFIGNGETLDTASGDNLRASADA